MGYRMEQRDHLFVIKAENKNDVLKAITEIEPKPYTWVSEKYQFAPTLEEAFSHWRWEIYEEPETGDVFGICFDGEKLGDDEVLFNAIAPFVEAGSYIEMSGDEGAIWRWTFDGSKCEEKDAIISWP